jgi:hypothetical protein
MHRLGTFAETAVIDYRLSFADEGNKLPVSISVAAKKEVFRFPFSVFSKQTEVADLYYFRFCCEIPETWILAACK